MARHNKEKKVVSPSIVAAAETPSPGKARQKGKKKKGTGLSTVQREAIVAARRAAGVAIESDDDGVAMEQGGDGEGPAGDGESEESESVGTGAGKGTGAGSGTGISPGLERLNVDFQRKLDEEKKSWRKNANGPSRARASRRRNRMEPGQTVSDGDGIEKMWRL